MSSKENINGSVHSEKFEKVTKHTAKDSVFCDLFKIPKYLLQLYQALHPEDHETTEEHITNVTITNIFLDQWYNDVGFQIGEKLVVLVEQQSSWSSNIVVRCLLYLAQTYQEYIKQTKQNVYKSTKIKLPKPELYVIYTGTRKQHPESLCLSEEFFNGEESAVDVRVKMIYDGKTGDIINQYVTFTRIYNEQIKLHGKTRKAVLETIRICKDKNILKEYLENREKEVVNIMMMLFDEEYILKTYIESEIQEAAEKAEKIGEKKAEKRAEKKAVEKTISLAQKLHKKGNSLEDIAELLDVSENDVRQWIK